MWSSGRSEELSFHDDLPIPIVVQPVRSARRMRLRLDESRGLLKLTCPQRMSRRKALAWAAEQREWVEQQLARMAPAEPLTPGSRIPIHGRDVELVWSANEGRTPRLVDGQLRCGGPESAFPRRIEAWLKRLALDTLSRETAQITKVVGVVPVSVGIGDAGTRWGSCSAQRRIRYSWRLILAPPDARRYVVAHEVAHLVHLNHGPDFKALETKLFGGDVAAARALLRRAGPRLKRIGRGG